MILVECYSDELLLRLLEFSDQRVRHDFGGKGKILARLEKNPVHIGMIDEDPGKTQPHLLSKYQVLEDHQNFDILEHLDLPKVKIIRLKPYLEQWILDRARESKMDITMYGYPDNAIELHRRGRIDQQRKFVSFLTQLIHHNQVCDSLKDRIQEFYK